MWRDTVLASTGYVLGIVIYTGIETKAQMNTRKSKSKQGKLDYEINKLSKVLFLILFGVAIVIQVQAGFHSEWYIDTLRYLLLLSSIIPISLRVSMDIAKIFHCYSMYYDSYMEECIPRNSTIPEDLGRI